MANEERRSGQVTVIMPEEVVEVIPEEIMDAISLDTEESLTLDLKRTKKYVQAHVLDRPTGEIWKQVNDQMVAIILLVRDASIKWLEIWTNSVDRKAREEAKQHFVALTREAANLAEQRAVIARAIGLNVSGGIGATELESLPTLYDPKPMNKEDFEKMFLPLTPAPAFPAPATVKK